MEKDHLVEFREIFNLVDRNGGGTITKGEILDSPLIKKIIAIINIYFFEEFNFEIEYIIIPKKIAKKTSDLLIIRYSLSTIQ